VAVRPPATPEWGIPFQRNRYDEHDRTFSRKRVFLFRENGHISGAAIFTIQNLAGELSSFHQWGILEQSTGYALSAKKHINCNGNRYGCWWAASPSW